MGCSLQAFHMLGRAAWAVGVWCCRAVWGQLACLVQGSLPRAAAAVGCDGKPSQQAAQGQVGSHTPGGGGRRPVQAQAVQQDLLSSAGPQQSSHQASPGVP